MRKDILEKIEALHKAEDTLEVIRNLKGLKEDYYNVARIESEQALEKFLEEGGNRADFDRPKDEIDLQFKDLVTKLGERIKSFRERQKQEQLKNFDKKSALLKEIDELKELEHIGKALSRMKEIQDDWKEIGPVPKEKSKNLSSEYSLKLDEFYYGIKIYGELQDHDFKKNLTLRQEIIEKIKGLQKEESIKELQLLLPAIMADWDQQGPVNRNEWEALRDEYWTAVRVIQDKIRGHFKEVKDSQKESLENKRKVLDTLKALIEKAKSNSKPGHWDKSTKRVIELQKEWKNLGYAGKKVNDEIWKEFRALCDQFFSSKDSFFQNLKGELKDVRAFKQRLIDQVRELKESNNWRETTKKIQQIQKRWKDGGNLLRGEEQKYWNQFRAECDHFFNRKKEWFDTLDDRKAENFKKKTSFLNELEKISLAKELEKVEEQLTTEFKKFYDIGPVPDKEASELMKRFQNIQKDLLEKAGLDAAELKDLQYKVKLERLGESENPIDRLTKEKADLERQLKNIDSDKIQYENNLGFFQHVADDNPMKKEVLDKVKALESRKEAVVDRIKLIKAELRKLREVKTDEQ